MTDTPAVAIVGMSGRFPGADSVEGLWRNLRDGVCSIADFEEAQLEADGGDPAEFRHPAYVASHGYLADADRFEAPLFGFNRSDAAALDPQHRLLLESAWSALEDAGFDPRRAPRRTGVYVGASATEHQIAAQTDRGLAMEFSALQLRVLTDREFIAPWLSYRLDLDGPSLTVQTACSTSLTAVHLAAQALLLGECDAALAGGVSVSSLRRRGYSYQEGSILSPDGRCRPFDEKAAGTVPGDGVGVVVLRRLEDALDAGEPIRALIRGSAVTNDGAARVGFTAPGVERQTAAIVEAWATAGLEPSAAQYIEMHGTGTSLGDRVELAAVSAALAGPAPDAAGLRPCAVGSLKSNLGHLDAAAGVAGLIKVVTMLEHRRLVPTVNVDRPRTELEADRSPMRLVTRSQAWPEPDDGTPRRAGVTSLGIGGTNVHVVLEAAPATRSRPSRPDRGWQTLPLSARTPQQLVLAAQRLASHLETHQNLDLADVAHTLQTGRASLAARSCILARGSDDAVSALRELAAAGPALVPAMPRIAGPGPLDGAADALRRLAESWIGGAAVAWPPPAPDTRRVHLPTYPFAGDRFADLAARPRPNTPHPAETPEPQPQPTADDAPAVPVPREAELARLVADALGLAGDDELDLTYFGAGGDSLSAIHLVDRLAEEFSIEVPLELFLEPEPRTLRELIRTLADPPAESGPEESLLDLLLNELEHES